MYSFLLCITSHLDNVFLNYNLFQLNQGVFSQGIPRHPDQKHFDRSHSVRGKTSSNSALVRPVLKLQVKQYLNFVYEGIFR